MRAPVISRAGAEPVRDRCGDPSEADSEYRQLYLKVDHLRSKSTYKEFRLARAADRSSARRRARARTSYISQRGMVIQIASVCRFVRGSVSLRRRVVPHRLIVRSAV